MKKNLIVIKLLGNWSKFYLETDLYDFCEEPNQKINIVNNEDKTTDYIIDSETFIPLRQVNKITYTFPAFYAGLFEIVEKGVTKIKYITNDINHKFFGKYVLVKNNSIIKFANTKKLLGNQDEIYESFCASKKENYYRNILINFTPENKFFSCLREIGLLPRTVIDYLNPNNTFCYYYYTGDTTKISLLELPTKCIYSDRSNLKETYNNIPIVDLTFKFNKKFWPGFSELLRIKLINNNSWYVYYNGKTDINNSKSFIIGVLKESIKTIYDNGLLKKFNYFDQIDIINED